ncbi:MAG: phospholipase D-like domain-containing protein, partial [Thermomicrobiales bacterium]
NRELAAITTRRAEVRQAAAIFAADWDRLEEPEPGPLVVSPTDSRQRLIGLIESARSSLDIYAEVVRDEAVIEALSGAESRGVNVRLVVSPEYSDQDRGQSEREWLAAAGVEIRFARGEYIHAKLIIVDGATVWLGSQNFTATSLDQNREVGMVIDDTANVNRVREVFDADFATGRQE